MIQSRSTDSTNTNMAFTLDPDDDPAVLNVASFEEDHRSTNSVGVDNEAYFTGNPGAFTTENPLYEYPRVQSNSVNVQPEKNHVNMETTSSVVEAAKPDFSDESKSNFNAERENFHKDQDDIEFGEHEKVFDATIEARNFEGTRETEEPKEPTKPGTDSASRRSSAHESTRCVSNVSKGQASDGDDNVFYD